MYAPKEILVPIDFSEPSRAATQRALMMATTFGASVHLLHAVQDPIVGTYAEASIPRSVFDTLRDQAREQLRLFQSELKLEGVVISAEVTGPEPVSAIRAAAVQQSANLIVMGTQGLSGWKHLFLGSVAERTLRTADCPVLAVKESEAKARTPLRRVLVATDFSVHSERATRVALDLAQAFGATVDILHVFTPPARTPGTLIAELHALASTRLSETVCALEAPGLKINGQLCDGLPSEVIGREAEHLDADLIVMGTRGTTGLKHVFLGSVAERTLRLASCSVLTTKDGDRL